MGKAFADPLFMFLSVVIVVQVVLYREWLTVRRMSRAVGIGLPVLTVATAVLWLLSTHAAESYLIERLSSIHSIPTEAEIADIDVVIVLSGGFVDGPPQYEQPDWWSTARVVQGARTFMQSDARLLIVTGYWAAWGKAEDDKLWQHELPQTARLALGMKSLAIALGVPAEQVVIEPNARTTREHPVEIVKLGVVGEDETVGIVTSSWHLPRAIREFEKHFAHVVAVPAYDTAVSQKAGLLRWLPRSRSLESSATAIAEYVGIIWYRLLA